MKVIAVANPKGGVGKTTTSVHLSTELAKKHKVILIDLDPNWSASKYLADDKPVDGYTSNIFSDTPMKLSEIAIDTGFGFDMVKADPKLIDAKYWLNEKPMAEMRFRMAIDADEGLKAYDYVILDTAGEFGVLLHSALFAADEIVIGSKNEASATDQLDNLISLIEDINELRASMGKPSIPVKALILLKVNIHRNADKGNLDRVILDYGDRLPVAGHVTSDSSVNDAAWQARMPVQFFKPKHKAAQEWGAIVEELYP